MNNSQYGFDPTYNYNLEQLLTIGSPREPKAFDAFWQARYQRILTIEPQVQLKQLYETPDWQVLQIGYSTTNQLTIRGWLLLPRSGIIQRGFIVGHGYGGRGEPDFQLPFNNAALLFPCLRGLGLSTHPSISAEANWHVIHNINQRDNYIIGGCVDDVWLAVSSLLQLFPHLAGRLGFLGISFSAGIGALALAWEQRIARGHLNMPTFGHHPLRLRLPTLGSAVGLQQFYHCHKKLTLRVLRYYDAALTAKRINIPMHCACAVYDPFVAPPTQFAVYNALATEKRLFVLLAGHHSYPEQQQQQQALRAELNAFFAPLNS